MVKENIKSDKYLKDLAVRMAEHCVRNTIIEDYHAEGKLNDSEMKKFNIEVANKIYTLLRILNGTDYKDLWDSPMFDRMFYRPGDWDTPELDDDFIQTIKLLRKRKKI